MPTSYGFVTSGLEKAFVEACQRLCCKPLRPFARVGYQSKSWGCEVEVANASGWLKVSGIPRESSNVRREREEAADRIAVVPKPQLISRLNWSENNVEWSAIVTTLVGSNTVVQLKPAKREAIVSECWFKSLRIALDALATVPTEHYCRSPDYVFYAIWNRFGEKIPVDAVEWRTVHGDLNWENVTAPNLMLLDWETWGLAPRGYDQAYLLVHSMSMPVLAERLESAFRDDFASRSGCISLLVACAEMLNSVEETGESATDRSILETIAQRALERLKNAAL